MPPTSTFFLFFIFVKYNFSGADKCVFKYTCTRDRPFSFPYPSKYAWHFCALMPLPRGDHGRRLKVVMVEGFPLFATMAFVICCVTKEGSSTPIKDWFGCKVDSDVLLSTFYHEFCNGKFHDQPVEDAQRRAFATVKVGSSNSSTNDFIRVSSNSSVTDVTKTLGSFVMFVLPAEIEERRHGEGSKSANMSRPNLFNVLMQNARDSSTSLPPLFPEGRHPQKAKLLNAIIKWLESIGVGWPPDTVKSLGLVFVNTLADAMWYIDQNHDTLVKRGHRVPDILCQFSGFRHPEQQKKRKIDSSFLKQDELKEHGSALYNLALASYLQKGPWTNIRTAILSLADSLVKYGNYLASQNKRVSVHFTLFSLFRHLITKYFIHTGAHIHSKSLSSYLIETLFRVLGDGAYTQGGAYTPGS